MVVPETCGSLNLGRVFSARAHDEFENCWSAGLHAQENSGNWGHQEAGESRSGTEKYSRLLDEF